MPFPSMTNVTQLVGVLWDEFQHLYAQLEGWLRTEHKDDGSHADVTADSLTTAGAITIADENGDASTLTRTVADGLVLDLNGTRLRLVGTDPDLAASGNVEIGLIDHTNEEDGPGLRINSGAAGSNTDRSWDLYHAADGSSASSLRLHDATADADVVEVRRFSTGAYELVPNRVTKAGGTVNLGSANFSASAEHFTNIYGDNVRARLGVFELARSVANGAWQTYTPGWAASGTTPAIGNGTLEGRYMYGSGKTVTVQIRLVAGSTTTFGTGFWTFALPETAAHHEMDVGIARLVDAGTAFHIGIVRLSTATLLLIETPGASTAVGNIVPFTWAQSDILMLQLTFEIA